MAKANVYVEKLAVTMKLGNNGVLIRVTDDDDKLRGYLQINRGYIDWYKGKKQTPSRRIKLNDFIAEAENG